MEIVPLFYYYRCYYKFPTGTVSISTPIFYTLEYISSD